MREAFYGATRFEEFVRRAELSEPAASARLHELVEHGLLELEPYQEPGQRTRNRYRLTEKGADLFPVIASLMQWGRQLAARARRPGRPDPRRLRRQRRRLARLLGGALAWRRITSSSAVKPTRRVSPPSSTH